MIVNGERQYAFGKSAGAAVAALLLLLALELATQARSQYLTGRSVFNARTDKSTFVYNEELGFSLLRPDNKVSGANATVKSNRLGLRGPDITRRREEGEWRLAVLGASSIFGATTTRNENTIPARLEAYLSRSHDEKVTVINAGIPGMTLNRMETMLGQVVLPLGPQLVIFYPGFQHISGSCREQTEKKAGFKALWPELPAWVQLDDIIIKNSAFLRERPERLQPEPPELSVQNYVDGLNRLLQTATDGGVELVLATAARGYRHGLTEAENKALSRNTRMFAPCFSSRGLIAATAMFNQAIRDFASDRGLALVDLANAVPGGWDYFDDGNHFSKKGEELASAALAEALLKKPVMQAMRRERSLHMLQP